MKRFLKIILLAATVGSLNGADGCLSWLPGTDKEAEECEGITGISFVTPPHKKVEFPKCPKPKGSEPVKAGFIEHH